jgi:hypothetical protein
MKYIKNMDQEVYIMNITLSAEIYLSRNNS